MEKAVIYFNYFAFQASSNIEAIPFEAIHPRILTLIEETFKWSPRTLRFFMIVVDSKTPNKLLPRETTKISSTASEQRTQSRIINLN